VETWFAEFQRMALELGTLSEEQKVGQFDVVMQKFFPQDIARIYEFEIAGNKFDL
jgi:hypothetical protein